MYKEFDYFEPKSLPEATEILGKYEGSAKIVNGGTDIVVRMNQNICPSAMVNIKYIPGMDTIEEDGNEIHIGALVRHTQIMESQLIREKIPVLAEAVETIGTPQIRNRGTLSGNICNSSPVADSFTALMVLNAKISIVGKNGKRFVPISEFQTGPGKNVLEDSEIVDEIIIPVPDVYFRAKFCKLGPRKAADIAIVNVAVSMEIKDDICTDAKIALGAVAPKIIYASHAMKLLNQKEISAIDAAAVAEVAAAEDASPISDFRSSKEYRSEMVSVLVERAITDVIK